MRCVVILAVVVCLLLLGAALFVWSGQYNIAANVPHWKATYWLLSTARDRSISDHSKTVTTPSLTHPGYLDIGFRNYHAMCRLCHNAPGHNRSEIARGLYPAPPDFASTNVKKRSDTEVYWIVKNGIKMSGMAAFGATHSEDEILGLVSFVQRLPSMASGEYAAMVKAAGMRPEDEHHH